MSHRKIFFKLPESCSGCRTCEIVCSLYHEKTGVNPKRSRIRVVRFPEKGVMIPLVCRFCEDAPCVAACPRKALSQNVETGVIMVNEDMCDGCGWCMVACDFGGITIHPTKKAAIVCDLCDGGLQCVKYCVNETLDFLKPEQHMVAKGRALVDKTVPSIWTT